MPITVEITKEKLLMTSSGKKRWNEILAKKNVEQMRKKLDANGSKLPEGVDLFDTGRLQREVSATEEGYFFNVEYAENVDDRFHFSGLSTQSLQEIEPQLETIANQEFYTEKMEG